MIPFFKYLLSEKVNYDDLGKVVGELSKKGFNNATIKKNRVVILTNERITALKAAKKILKKYKPEYLNDMQAKRLSSIGVLKLNNGVVVMAKPVGKKDPKEAERVASGELDQLIKSAVQDNGGPIDIKIGKLLIAGVVSANSDVKGDPKADIVLLDENDKEVGFISHKKEGGAAAFQQYSGISEKSGSEIYNNSLVKDFVEDVYEFLQDQTGGDEAEQGMSFLKEISKSESSEKLLGMSVYGFDWNSGLPPFNLNSVHCIGQGTPLLEKSGKYYKLDFSDSMHVADTVDWMFEGDYRAVFGATFRVGRSISQPGIEINNLRGGIYPYGFMKGRKYIEL